MENGLKGGMPSRRPLPAGSGRRMISPELVRRLVGAGSPAALRFGGALLQFLATLFIARFLGAGRSGEFFFWASIFRSTGQVSTFGLDQVALQQVPRIRQCPEKEGRYYSSLRSTVLLISLVSAAIVSVYALLLSPDPERPGWWYLIPVVAISGVAFCHLHGEIMNGKGKPVLGVLYRHTLPTFLFFCILVSVVYFVSTDHLLAFFSLTFIAAGVGAIAGPGFRDRRPFLRLPAPTELREHLRRGYPLFVCSIFTALTYIVPLALLERSRPTEDVAFFTTAYRLFMLFEVLSTAIHSRSMPDLSRAGAAGDLGSLRRIYGRSTLNGLMLIGPAILGCFLLADPVMVIFGPEFEQAAPILRFLLGFALISLAVGPAPYLVLMVGKTGRMALYAFTRFASSITLSLLLIPVYGPGGMAIALGSALLGEKFLCLRHLVRTPKV